MLGIGGVNRKLQYIIKIHLLYLSIAVSNLMHNVCNADGRCVLGRNNCIRPLIVSVFASSAVYRGSEHRWSQTNDYKTIKFALVASPLSAQHFGVRTNTG